MESKKEIIVAKLEMIESEDVKEFVVADLSNDFSEEENKKIFEESIKEQKEGKVNEDS